jgi:hypothetical protein
VTKTERSSDTVGKSHAPSLPLIFLKILGDLEKEIEKEEEQPILSPKGGTDQTALHEETTVNEAINKEEVVDQEEAARSEEEDTDEEYIPITRFKGKRRASDTPTEVFLFQIFLAEQAMRSGGGPSDPAGTAWKLVKAMQKKVALDEGNSTDAERGDVEKEVWKGGANAMMINGTVKAVSI